MSVLMMMTTVIRFSAYTQSALRMMMVCLEMYTFLDGLLKIFFLIPERFVVAFVKTVYTVTESELMVEVCVNLTRPDQDILENTVIVNVFKDENSEYIPGGAVIASMCYMCLNCILYQ